MHVWVGKRRVKIQETGKGRGWLPAGKLGKTTEQVENGMEGVKCAAGAVDSERESRKRGQTPKWNEKKHIESNSFASLFF